MIHEFGLATCLAALPGICSADCVTSSDLERGILVSYGDESSEIFYSFGQDTIAADYTEAGTKTSRSVLLHGVYLVEYLSFDDNGRALFSDRETYAFPQGAAGMPSPYPGGAFEVVATGIIDGSLNSETQAYTFRDETSLDLSGCTYRVVPVEVRYPDDEEVWIEYLQYLPDLGIALYVATRDSLALTEFPALAIGPAR